MCGRYAIEYPEEFASRFGLNQLPPNLSPNYNAAPGQILPVILKGDSSSSNKTPSCFAGQLQLMQWGLIPFWAKDPQIGYKMINARAETVSQKPAYRKAFAKQRCLVPARGFYEWQKQDKGKLPYYIHLKNNTLFSFAGLYDIWHNPENDQPTYTFTIITTNPTKLLKPIHNRMPAILKPNQEPTWLDPQANPNQLLSLLETSENSALEAYPVSKLVNRPQNNNPDLIKPLENLTLFK